MQLTSEMPTDVRYRVPQDHGACIAVPSLQNAGRLIADNQDQFETATVRSILIGNTSLHALRKTARERLLDDALAYTGQYAVQVKSRSPIVRQGVGAIGPIILTGHQPEFYHPGVWIKNFAASTLAVQQQGTAINLLVDNDVVTHPRIRIPQLNDNGHPSLTDCDIDTYQQPMPYEQRAVIDWPLFRSFGDRAAELVRPIVKDPLVEQMWPSAIRAAERHGNLGRAVAESRHLLELEFGLDTLDVPLSVLCDTDSFRLFASHLMHDLARFRMIYNESINNYRQTHRLRGNAHPAPLLQMDGPELESPFWIWSSGSAVRKPLIIRRANDGLELLQGHQGSSVGKSTANSVEQLATTLAELDAKGIRIRPRALITTLYCRLVLCDLFIHGIGGGKYDQVTNAIMHGYFGTPTLDFMVMTATFRLPFHELPVQADDIRQLDGLLRSLWWHPECNSEQVVESQLEDYQRLAAEKRALIGSKPDRGLKSWHQQIESLNEKLRGFLTTSREKLNVERNRLIGLRQAGKIISSREFSLCLFDGNNLRRELRRLVG